MTFTVTRMKTTIAGTMAAAMTMATLALPAFAVDRADAVKSIEVTADMGAVQNTAAAAYWATLDKDLETAILTKVTDRMGDEGAAIIVDIDEVSLASGFAESIGLADSKLSGLVKVSDPTQPGRGDSYTLTVDMNSTLPALGAGFDITSPEVDTAAVYAAMLDTFAAQVVTNLK